MFQIFSWICFLTRQWPYHRLADRVIFFQSGFWSSPPMTITRSVRPWYGHWRPGVKCLRKKTWSDRPWYGHWGLLNLYGHWWVKLFYYSLSSSFKFSSIFLSNCLHSSLEFPSSFLIENYFTIFLKLNVFLLYVTPGHPWPFADAPRMFVDHGTRKNA